MILILILAFTLCKPTTSSSNKSNQALFPLALLGSTTVSSEYEIPYATCEGAKEFTKETGTVTDQTPANTIKYFKFNSAKTESLNFSVNPSIGNGNGSFCLFGFVQNQTVDNNSSLDTLETTSDYCVSSFSLSTNASSYRCIAVLALSSGGSFDLKTSVNTGSSSYTSSNIKPDFTQPTILTDGQTTNETFGDYSSYPAFKASDNYGGGKYFKFTIPANKSAIISISNYSSTAYLSLGFYNALGNLLASNVSMSGYTANNRSLTVTAGATSEDVIFYLGGGTKGITYSVNVSVQGKIETKSFISSGLTAPNGLAIDSSGNIYVTDTGAYKVTKFNSSGIQQWSVGNGSGDVVGNSSVAKFGALVGIAVDTVGNVYVTDQYVDKVKMIDPTGTSVSLIAGTTYGDNGALNDVPGNTAKFRRPAGLAVDNLYVYVVDTLNYSIRRIKKTDNTVSLLAGPGTQVSGFADGIGFDARFAGPKGLAVSGGFLYVGDNYYVRKINLTTSEVTTVSGKTRGYVNGDTSTVTFDFLQGLAVDSSGNIYVTASNVVYKLIPGGKTFNYAGNGNYGDILGFGVASNFNFAGFPGLAFDTLGTLYVSDPGSGKIKKIVFSP